MSETESQQASSSCNCGCHGFGPMATEFFERIGPPEDARKHFHEARIEFLKGLRSFIDARIDHLNRKTSTQGTKVTVE